MSKRTKSPFFVIPNFISPLLCEQVVDGLDFTVPDTDKTTNKPIKMIKHHSKLQDLLFDNIKPLIHTLELHYDLEYKGTERFSFEWFPQGAEEGLKSENSDYIRKKWVLTKNRDLTGIIFLSDWQDSTPFDSEYEVYGGKCEFPTHDFGFNPTRGALIIYPSGPHFMNATAPVVFGDLYRVKFHIAAQTPYLYDPSRFPGDYSSWFKNI